MERTDEQLVAKYLKGDEGALEILIKRYLKPIYSFVYRRLGNSEAAEDITQEVFVKMWRNLKKFKAEKKFSAWLFTIAKNSSIDFLKKKKAIPFSHFENEKGENFIADSFVQNEDLLETIEQKNIVGIMNAALKNLSPSYRVLVLMRHTSNLTFREIAASLGEPLNTVKSRHRRALILLRRMLV
jgi:RNA polymerase sigma-70 factor (ECF subfamily)